MITEARLNEIAVDVGNGYGVQCSAQWHDHAAHSIKFTKVYVRGTYYVDLYAHPYLGDATESILYNILDVMLGRILGYAAKDYSDETKKWIDEHRSV